MFGAVSLTDRNLRINHLDVSLTFYKLYLVGEEVVLKALN
jgi:hypothetical protein